MKKKKSKVKPEAVARETHIRTKSRQPVGANEHNFTSKSGLYSKKKFLEHQTYHLNNPDEENKTQRYEALNKGPYLSSFITALRKYASDPHHRDITKFFVLYEIPYSSFWELMQVNKELANEYELALLTLSYNNLVYLDRKDLSYGATTAALRLHDRFHVPFRHQTKMEKEYEIQVKARVMKQLQEDHKEFQQTFIVKTEY